jgi:hypothetical protein
MKKFLILCLIITIILFNKINLISTQCGSIAKGCPGKCDEGYHCAPFWGGQCACFSNR